MVNDTDWGISTQIIQAKESTSRRIAWDSSEVAALPYSHASTVVRGGASTEAVYNLSNAGFDITFNHSLRVDSGGNLVTRGQVHFRSDQDVNYAASGAYSSTNSEGHPIYFTVGLFDVLVSGPESNGFKSYQHSINTPTESFILGQSGGDELNQKSGSLTGTLLAGKFYVFYYDARLAGLAAANHTATGTISLTFSPVPEPSTALLLGMGLVAMGATRRYRPGAATSSAS
jgi:hypothetical protein